PDISGVGVANDDAGNIAITVTVPNRQGLIEGDFISINLDTDQNPSTGSGGDDYFLGALGQTGDDYFSLCRWEGTWNCAAPQGSSRGLYAFGSYRLTWTLNRADIGLSNGFNFEIGASWKGLYDTYYDFAPDVGKWNYQLSIAAPPPPSPPP